MAVTTSDRLKITRWGGGNDPFVREQLDDSHESLEDRAGTFFKGPIASLPTLPDTEYDRALYLANDVNVPYGILYYSDGVTWVSVNSYAAPVAQTPGDAITQGVLLTHARSDHKHSLPGWGASGDLASIGTGVSAGALNLFARADHAHILANGAVTAGKIAAGGVSATNQLADGIVTTAKIAPGAINSSLLSVDQSRQTGEIIMWGGAVAPTGWVLCNGASYATAAQPALFAVIGYIYGGSGANFLAPNLMGRVPVGAGAGAGLTSRALGAMGGVETVTLDTTMIQAHSHTVNSHSHTGSTGYANLDHVHAMNFISGAISANHTHTYSGTSAGQNLSHVHTFAADSGGGNVLHIHVPSMNDYAEFWTTGLTGNNPTSFTGYSTANGAYVATSTPFTHYDNTTHYHSVSGTTDLQSQNHAHAYSGTTGEVSNGHSHTIIGSTGVMSQNHLHAVTAEAPGTTNTGGGAAHANVQPFTAVSFIIKI